MPQDLSISDDRNHLMPISTLQIWTETDSGLGFWTDSDREARGVKLGSDSSMVRAVDS